jgi:predicted metal-dependent phosphotriesterase family hydrolase
VAISEQTGVHIIMSAGLHERAVVLAASSAVLFSSAAEAASPEDNDPATALADQLVAELNIGVEVGNRRIRAGLLTLGDFTLRKPPSEEYILMLRGTAQAQMRTAVPLLCPLPTHEGKPAHVAEGASEALRLLLQYGAQPTELLVGHAQHLLGEGSDLEPLRALLRVGVSLVFDGMGTHW